MAVQPNLDRLLSTLMTTGLQQKDNALFQVISQLIKATKQLQNATIQEITIINGGVTNLKNEDFLTFSDESIALPNSRQLLAGLGIAFDDTVANQRTIEVDGILANIAALTPDDGEFIVGNGITWITESGNIARTSLGLGTGDSPTFAGLIVGPTQRLYLDGGVDTYIVETSSDRLDLVVNGGIAARFRAAGTTTIGVLGPVSIAGNFQPNGGISADAGLFTVEDGTGAIFTASTMTFAASVAPIPGSNQAGLYSADIGGGIVGMRGIWEDGTTGTLGLIVTKTTTGDPTPHEGLIVINEADVTVRMYAQGNWRQFYPVSGAGLGDVTGPASSTDNGFPRYNGTSGKIIKDGAATIALGSEVSGDLPLANLVPASAASVLLGRGDSGAGDYQEITLSGLTIVGTVLTASGGSGGGLVLLSTQVASSVAAIDFTSLITSTYDLYVIEILNARPSADASLQILLSTDNGSTWLSAGYKYAIQLINQNGTQSTSQSNGTTAFFTGTAEASAGRAGVSSSIKFFNPLSASLRKALTFHSMGDSSDGNQYNLTGMLFMDDVTAVNAIRFQFSGGNQISTGTFCLYGIAK